MFIEGSTGAEREKHKKIADLKRENELKLMKQNAEKLLTDKEFSQAQEIAVEVMKRALSIYKKGSQELISCYLLISETNIVLNHFKKAEEFLSLANWNIVKSGEECNAEKSKLYVLYGRMYSESLKYDEAINQIANGVYYSSLEFGPEHILTSVGYFHLANIFQKMTRIENALALYDKVVDIWYKFLASVQDDPEQSKKTEECMLKEALIMFQHILQIRMRSLGEAHIATGEAEYTLGLLYLFIGDHSSSRSCISKALEIYIEHLGEEHMSTKDVQGVLQQLNKANLHQQS